MHWLRLEGVNPVLHERYFPEIRVTEDGLGVECILMHNSSGLQCATVSCSVPQCLAVSCSVLQCLAAYSHNRGLTRGRMYFNAYGLALVSRIDKMTGLFCKRAL